ncbi:MAG TPA: hypothetical protein VLH56_12540 [Dissulfurispiraceae bacterium]|nr:hypothetical protein [Dissulfurispiraceae bacterium]
MTVLALILVVALLLNIPCGYLRSREPKYSWKWFLWVHIPVPMIVALRIFMHTELKYIPLIILAAALGQFLGGRMGVN